MKRFAFALVSLAGTTPAAAAAAAANADAHATAAAFGAREGVEQLALSPSGTQIAFLAPSPTGQGSTLFTVSTAEGATPKPALSVSGAPDRLDDCRWVSEARLVCTIRGLVKVPDTTRPLGYSRVFAVDAGGGNQKMLSNKQTNQHYTAQYGGQVIDWLPGSDGQVLMMRDYQRTDTLGTNIGSNRQGTGVDRVDSRTGAASGVEPPKPTVSEYITDGKGNVRVAGFAAISGTGTIGNGQFTGTINYSYRTAASRAWQPLGAYNVISEDGFNPYAVDPTQDVVYGLRKLDGRQALYRHSLDGKDGETLVASRPDVDIDGLVRIGRARRVVGYTYVTEKRVAAYFDPAVRALVDALHRALPGLPQIDVVDASSDESRLLIHASSDNDPGRYYLFDRAAKKLQLLMLTRPELDGRTLATVEPVRIKVHDGSIIPGYLTLPPSGPRKGLPAIVMPHGGPTRRDEWGFDWLPQFFAARGYAVLQPNYRGSSGYGDAYLMKNGFKAWRTAIGDVVDAGRWLVSEGIAAPDRLAIVGWSYGGYAALESGVIDPTLFKAIVAIAPVTNLSTLNNDLRDFAVHRINLDYVGKQGPEASPALSAGKIAAPVLLVHGTLDANVGYAQSQDMAARLKAAGKPVELLTFDGLDHGLDDSAARTQLLERSDAFLRTTLGIR